MVRSFLRAVWIAIQLVRHGTLHSTVGVHQIRTGWREASNGQGGYYRTVVFYPCEGDKSRFHSIDHCSRDLREAVSSHNEAVGLALGAS